MARLRLEMLTIQAESMQPCLRDPFDPAGTPDDDTCEKQMLAESRARELQRAELERLVNADY
jgi:hypothetical protein